MDKVYKNAPHNPPHWFLPNTIYMLTASTYQNHHLIFSPERKIAWRNAFIEAAKLYSWYIIAWVVLNNHYHAMVESPENPEDYPFSNYQDFLEQQTNFDFTGWEEVNDVLEY
jgi:REP element-mobilizing transposase RayT